MLRTPVLRFLVSICCSLVLFRRSSCFQIYCFRIIEQQKALPRCNDNDRECLVPAEQGVQQPLTIRITILLLFLQTSLAVFSYLSDLLPPYEWPIYDHFHCYRYRQDRRLFDQKKGLSLYPLFQEPLSRPIGEFFPLSFMLIL